MADQYDAKKHELKMGDRGLEVLKQLIDSQVALTFAAAEGAVEIKAAVSLALEKSKKLLG